MMPAVAAALHMQMDMIGTARTAGKARSAFVPLPSLRINAASVMVPIVDIEAYIMDHFKAESSHSICMECARKHYPDLDLSGQ
jgi:hypothetical protein